MASMVPYSLSCQTDFTVPAPQRRSSPNALVISSCCTSSAVFSLAAYYPSASVLTGKLPARQFVDHTNAVDMILPAAPPHVRFRTTGYFPFFPALYRPCVLLLPGRTPIPLPVLIHMSPFFFLRVYRVKFIPDTFAVVSSLDRRTPGQVKQTIRRLVSSTPLS